MRDRGRTSVEVDLLPDLTSTKLAGFGETQARAAARHGPSGLVFGDEPGTSLKGHVRP